MQEAYTVGELAYQLSTRHGKHIPVWKVRRTADAITSNLPRFAGIRQVPADLIPQIEQRLGAEGWIDAAPAVEPQEIIA